MSDPLTSQALVAAAVRALEKAALPDTLVRLGIRALLRRTSRQLARSAPNASEFARAMRDQPIARHVEAANAQHYELPARFFELVIGPQRKYSCALYASGATTLSEAEEAALGETARHAGLAGGQRILELGCGWVSLTLWMARHYPNAQIMAISNSHAQRDAILARAKAEGLTNVEVRTIDVNVLKLDGQFDRIVSVEMFEHMSNWHGLLQRARAWLKPEGRLFVHVFSHRGVAYRFDHDDPSDWIGQHFFTGGIMPCDGLMANFADLFAVEQEWRWSGTHYERTAQDWLQNFDSHLDQINPLMQETYGGHAQLWQRRWRLFFLAVAGLFGYAEGEEWGVKHYLLRPVR
jgi:cyclopropane-fatty-acyl-phospholipid synthase